MSDHHDFSVIDRHRRQSWTPGVDDTAPNFRSALETALKQLTAFERAKTAEAQITALAKVHHAVANVERCIPSVQCHVVGYHWGRPGRDGDHPWSSFSGHATRAEAEAWLPYWSDELPHRSEWEIREMLCSIGTVMRGGPPEYGGQR
jgi:hypothetical protein